MRNKSKTNNIFLLATLLPGSASLLHSQLFCFLLKRAVSLRKHLTAFQYMVFAFQIHKSHVFYFKTVLDSFTHAEQYFLLATLTSVFE